MTIPSLTAEILTTKVNVGYADKLWSQERQQSDLMMCPMWHGFDLTGREACDSSFWTKNEGCHSAMDRVTVENDQRPQYFNLVTISAEGLKGEMYNNNYSGSASAAAEYKALADARTPEFGNLSGHRTPSVYGLDAVSEANRNHQRNYLSAKTNSYQSAAGNTHRFLHSL